MKRTLVCGVGGFIGGQLVKKLKSEGYCVRGVDIKGHEFTETERMSSDCWICVLMILRRIAIAGLLLLCMLFRVRTVGSYAWSNIGLLLFLDAAQGESSPSAHSLNRLETLFQQAVTLYPDNPGAHRVLGFVHWYTGHDLQALNEWQHTGLRAHDYVLFGQQAGSVNESLRWYNLAERLEPANSELWLHVGQLCQRDSSVGDVCNRFLAHNCFNWLVNPEFAFDRAGWNFNRREGADYAIMTCLDAPDKKCAMVQIHTVTSPHGTSWAQCLALEPGQEYHFSAWVKVETAGEWITLYYQGDQDGYPHGIKLGGFHTGTEDWTYFEQEFIAPEFDDHRACFHPLRLLDIGTAWFHSPVLRLVENH